MKRLYIVRHGQTQWNVQKRMQGRMDSPLTELGQAQAIGVGGLLRALGGVERFWVSPSGRTTETVHLINSHTHAQIDYMDALMERDCGAWSGLTVEEVQSKYAQEWIQREQDPYNFQPPNGESMADMRRRIEEFLEDLLAIDWQSIGLVTHSVMSKVILQHFLDLSDIEATRISHPNDLVYQLSFYADRIDVAYHMPEIDEQDGLLYTESTLQPHPSQQ